MYSDARPLIPTKLSRALVLLFTAATVAAGDVPGEAAAAAITAAPNPDHVFLRDDSQDVSFYGYLSQSGTWEARFCSASLTMTFSGKYAGCRSTTAGTAAIATGCTSGTVFVNPTLSAACSGAAPACITRILHTDLNDKTGYSIYGCGATTSASADLYLKTTGGASTASGSSVSGAVTRTSVSSSSVSSTLSTSAIGSASSRVVRPDSTSTSGLNNLAASTTVARSTTAVPPATSSAVPEPDKPSSAWIAGPAVGGAVGLAAIAGLAFWLIKRRQKKKREATPASVPVTMASPPPNYPSPSYPQYPSPPPPPMSANTMYQGQQPYQPPSNVYYGNNGYPQQGKFQEMSATTEIPPPVELHSETTSPVQQAHYYQQGRQ